MSTRNLCLFACLAALMLAGCPEPLVPPTAVISVLDPSAPVVPDGGVAGACTPLTASVDGKIGLAPALTGACSTDPQALGLEYSWSLRDVPTGSHAALHDATVIAPSFEPDLPGNYRLRLVVSNGTLTSAPADVVVTVTDCGINAPVIASVAAEPSATVSTGQAVRLTPTFSDSDADEACAAHAPVFTFDWRFEELPAGSTATLNDTTAIRPSFTPDVPGAYTVRVTVTDPTGRSATETIIVTAGVCRSNAPTATATTTTASVSPGAGVQLQGTADDADNAAPCSAGQTFTYAWRLSRVPAGSVAVLNDPSSDWPSFVADMPGNYVAELVVTDSTGLRSAAASVSVTADTCGTARPVALAEKVNPGTVAACGAGAIAVDFGYVPGGGGGTGVTERIHLNAGNSTDADNAAAPGCALNQTLFYNWSVLTAPYDGAWSISTTTGMTTDLQTRINGEYRVRLLVTDSTGLTSSETTCTFSVTGTRP